MVFRALNSPLADQASPVAWYLVRGGELLTAGPGQVPTGPAPGTGAAPAGLDGQADTDPIFLGEADGTPCWAMGVVERAEAPDGSRWEPLRAFGMTTTAGSWAVAARAVHLVDWVRTSRYCGRCGTATVRSPGERSMVCPSCGLSAFPRVAPAVIVLVHRGDEILLGRNGSFRGRMFSVLAGFVEPGETLEDTVHREIAEEAGIRLETPSYIASQPWPFPNSLMVGFRAAWASGEIEVDGQEIIEAAWYRRDRLPELPPGMSIARRMIDDWLAEGHGA